MSLYIASLNSGSNGNCYYISNDREAILIDAGISCRESEKRMKRLGLSMEKVKGIFVSHEHTDHIKGIPGISKKYRVPVYVTKTTLKACGWLTDKQLLNFIQPDSEIKVGELSVFPFLKSHDASEPQSFTVTGNNTTIGVFTDIGYSCKEVIRNFKKCHAVFLESNYCEEMLENGNYPVYLKKRISGDTGHLSNRQALELFLKHRGKQLQTLILSHLSKNNNSPQVVDQLFKQYAGSTNITIASRFEESPVFHISGGQSKSAIIRRIYSQPVNQLSLFP